MYNSIFFTNRDYSMGNLLLDNDTDNQARRNESDNIWVPGWKKVPNRATQWKWQNIRSINYFFDQVMPKYNSNKIEGDKSSHRRSLLP
uniref:hypothetical protein n=1 Tax=Ornithobacterium rhinotracheale TaxID=28251 RepID=UPI0039A6CC2C